MSDVTKKSGDGGRMHMNSKTAIKSHLSKRVADLTVFGRNAADTDSVSAASDQSTLPENRDFRLYNTKVSLAPPQLALTAAEYRTLQHGYDYLGAALFGDSPLPQVLITLQRRPRALGYFSAKRFQRRGGGEVPEQVHEVALNPDGFAGKTDEEILSTLAHEMVHVWQKEYGRCGRGRYHNRQWARKMIGIGLMPSTTGKPGGRLTGDRVSHYVMEGGPFQAACREFLKGYWLVWESAGKLAERPDEEDETAETTTQTRTKFTCPNCGLNVWAKPSARIACYSCSKEAGELILMLPNPSAQSSSQLLSMDNQFAQEHGARETAIHTIGSEL